jgi:hypothetical protein
MIRIAAIALALVTLTTVMPPAAARQGADRSVGVSPSDHVSRSHMADEFSSARRRPAGQRVQIVVRRSIFTEPGAVYGYPPGNYVLGAYGILYGPYPIRPVQLVYPPVF